MKRILLFCFLFVSAFVGALAQGEVVIGTNLPVGSTLKFYMTNVNTDAKVYVDWGDGVKQEATLSGWSALKNTEGVLKNDTIIVYGDFSTFDVEDQKVTVLNFKNQNSLVTITAKNNELTYDGLDFTGAPNIVNLDLTNNKIKRLKVDNLLKLEQFEANKNPELSTVIFANGSTSLKGIYMADCDITHFYPISLPNLNYLDLGNGNLDELDLGKNYPNLKSLTVTGNAYLAAIDVTDLAKLNKLEISGTGITELNLVNNPDLISLDASGTGIEKLDLTNNTKVTTLLLGNTKLTKLDISKLANLQTINLENTLVKRIDLSNSRFIRDVNMKNTAIQFLDMHSAIGTNRLNRLDIRNCAKMTPQSLNFTFMAMPPHNGLSYGTNVFIAGSNGETSKTEYLKYDEDNYYLPDVKGDGSAPMDSINIVMKPANGVAYKLVQVANDGFYATWNDITTKAVPGFPIKVSAKAPEGTELVGVEINGELYEDSVFVVSTTATIKPVFKTTGNNDYIRLTVPTGVKQQYYLAVSEEGSQVTIDWGDGNKIPVVVKTSPTAIEGTSSGKQVTIYGAVSSADFSSYPHISADNRITAVDVSHNNHLHWLSTYMNAIGTLNIDNLTELDTLDCGYSNIATLNINKNTKLVCLRANGNFLEAIDVSNAPELNYLEVNNNSIDELDLSKNGKLVTLIANNNSLTSVDVAHMPELQVLRVAGNVIGTLNIDNNTKLLELDASKNIITNLNLANNKELSRLMLNGNKLTGLDVKGLNNLSYINIGDNKWDACTMNDFYYTLSPYKKHEGDAAGYKLFSRGDVAKTYNDAEHAESKLATEKGWAVNYEGDGTGCDMAYVTIATTENGTVKVYTTTDTEVLNGTKVNKNTELKVVSTPANGYAVESATANGETLVDNKFKVTEATTVVVKFKVSDNINGVNSNSITVEGGNRELAFTTSEPIGVRVYTTGGKLVFAETVNGSKAVGLPSGVYIVKTRGISKAVVVK